MRTPSHRTSLYLKILTVIILSFTITTSLSAAPPTPINAKKDRDANRPESNQILIKFKQNVDNDKKAALLQKHNLKEKEDIKQIGVKVLRISDDDTAEEALQRIKFLDGNKIEFAEIDEAMPADMVPNDPYFPQEWQHPLVGTVNAWDSTTGDPNLVVAIADTGVDCTHPDLSCVPGWNFYDNNSDTHDVYGHGTAVAGTAVGRGNNNIGVAGYSWSKVMPLRISDLNGYAYWSTLANAITYAADHGAKVVNASYQATNSSSVQSAASYMRSKGGMVTISAGNTGANTGFSAVTDIVTVSATDSADNLYGWSSFGNDVDLAAPGCVTSTNNGGGYGDHCGTSFSAPSTAGLIALIFSANPGLTPDQVRSILFSSAKDFGTAGWDQYYGWGRIDAAKAILMALNTTAPAQDTTPPSTPSNLSAAAPDSTKVNLSWLASVDNVAVSGYNIFRDDVKIGTSTIASFIDTKVSPLVSYSYYVQAYDAANNLSALSNSVSVTVPDAPLTITAYSVVVKTGDSATFSWTANKLSSGKVSVGTSSSNLSMTVTDNSISTSHTVTMTGLKPGTRYYYQITAVSQDGLMSAKTAVSNFKTSRK